MLDSPKLTLAPVSTPIPPDLKEVHKELRRYTHKSIADVTNDIERFRFNRAVARIRELVNTINTFEQSDTQGSWVLREAIETVVKLVAPMLPHIAEEMWTVLGHQPSIVNHPWPEPDQNLTATESVTVAVQVNGKLRTTITLLVDTNQEEAERKALEDPTIIASIGDKPVRKVIVVPNRVINVVVEDLDWFSNFKRT